MRAVAVAVLVVAGGALFAQTPAERVASDATVLDRVAEASKRDLPRDLLKRIVNEDIELLRGRRTDGSYEYASYERFEAGRVSDSFSVQPRENRMETLELKGSNIYRAIVEIPTRRMLVRKNRPVWIERVDLELIADGSKDVKQHSFEVKAWMQPGESKPFDFPVIARQATVRVIATADEKNGYGNVDVALVEARIVDRADSPYAEPVASAKAALRALDNGDIPSLRASAQRMREFLGVRGPQSVVDVIAPRVTSAPDNADRIEMQAELQMIEDLLTGTEAERRQGMDRLHQLVRRLRP